MENAQPSVRSVSYDTGLNGFSFRDRTAKSKELIEGGENARAADENRYPATISRGAESMLKMTTETGDIGMFSIKPLRALQSSNIPRRVSDTYTDGGRQPQRQDFQPYGVPSVDDRRILPSYARDTPSDASSRYETASQRSAKQGIVNQDYRSYSMTQTSYSSYTLSNHRSYTSLRSQPEGFALQRPRSPFAYPARLRRPGFRPSSPALTDGGAIDYSRRAAIGRQPLGPERNVSSPVSLYALKRKPLSHFRPEGSKSASSLLSQASSPRRVSNSPMPQYSEISSQDWTRRNNPVYDSSSPARSTLSITSTVNTNAATCTPTAGKIPRKTPSQSPLYYDYTEQFEIDDYRHAVSPGSPGQIWIDQAIQEELPPSGEGPAEPGAASLEARNKSTTSADPIPAFRPIPMERASTANTTNFFAESGTSNLVHGEGKPDQAATGNKANGPVERRTVRISRFGICARELSDHVSESFRLPSSPSFEVKTFKDDNTEPNIKDENAASMSTDGCHHTQICIDNTPLSAAHPTCKTDRRDEFNPNSKEDARPQILGNLKDTLKSAKIPVSAEKDARTGFRHSISERRPRARSSAFDETGLTDLSELLASLEDAIPAKVHGDNKCTMSSATRVDSPTIPDDLMAQILQEAPSNISTPPPLSSLYIQPTGNDQRRQGQSRNQSHGRGQQGPGLPHKEDVPNFSHPNSTKLLPRSESPMLAPKPISPARQLKLKNSVPRIMKALPALPQELHFPSASSIQNAPSVQQRPCKIALAISEELSKEIPIVPEIPSIGSADSRPATRGGPKTAKVGDEKLLPAMPQPARLKLKMKSSDSSRPLSPSESQPWNLDWDLEENYPWSQSSTVRLPAVTQNSPVKHDFSNPPKFRLRVTKASGSKSEDIAPGTVRVNRTSGESNTVSGLHLQSPNDFFSPSTGFERIFRKVSEHIHSRKTSGNSNQTSEPDSVSSNLTRRPDFKSDSLVVSQDSAKDDLVPGTPYSVTEARSVFSEDSSQVYGNRGLRRRISRLRNKVTVPYATKAGTQSYDNITWKNRSGLAIRTPLTSQSIPDLNYTGASTEAKPMRRSLEKARRQKLKEKVHVWLKGAKLAIVARVSRVSRSTDESGSTA